MKLKYIFIAIIFCLSSNLEVNAQNTLPKADFLCVDNDTLKWEAEIIACGPFLEYAIFASQTESGPYSLLATITDPTITQYYHENANSANITWYYYILVNQDCLGYIPDFSDTLDNREPSNVGLHFVTALDSTVYLEWEPSSDPSVVGYIIALVNDVNLTVLDTVYGANAYTDILSDPRIQSWEYTLSAIDACGTTFIWDTLPQHTLFLQSVENKCNRSLELSWNDYKNWGQDVDSFNIYVGVNGILPTLIASVDSDSFSYVLEEVDDQFEYCFYVEARERNTGYIARSNQLCVDPDVIQPMAEIIILEVSITPTNEVQVIWTWDSDADIASYVVKNSQDNIAYRTFADSTNISSLNDLQEVYDVLMDSLRRQFYSVESIDSCDRAVLSGKASSIVLNGYTEGEFTNNLRWKDYFNENGVLMRYDIYRIEPNGQPLLIGSTGKKEVEFIDIVNGAEEGYSSNCYYVEAVARIFSYDEATEVRTFIDTSYNRSNIICLEQSTTFRMPNAFVPKGVNNVFRPLVVFDSNIETYMFQVYDRWGQLLFETNNLNEGWNGKFNNTQMPQGAYVYYITAKQNNGKLIEKKGSFVLIR